MTISKKRLKQISSIKDCEIDYSEISELGTSFWKRAQLVLPKNKKAISIRLEEEVLEWFRSKGQGYQTLMNAVLRSYMEAKGGGRR